MAGTTDVTTTPEPRNVPPGGRREAQAALRPSVDISETEEGITLLADLPGVSRDGLNLRVDGNTLLIEGESRLDLPEGLQPLYAEVRATRYRRTFGLSSELDAQNIEASLNHGVLTLRIPKRAEFKPRKIEVTVH